MYKILNDDTAANLWNSFVGRYTDQTDYHLGNSATDLTVSVSEMKMNCQEPAHIYSGKTPKLDKTSTKL